MSANVCAYTNLTICEELNSVDATGVQFGLDMKTSFLLSDYSPSKWNLLPLSQCSQERQSPINIETKKTMINKHLDKFIFTKFDDKNTIKSITNTGHSG